MLDLIKEWKSSITIYILWNKNESNKTDADEINKFCLLQYNHYNGYHSWQMNEQTAIQPYDYGKQVLNNCLSEKTATISHHKSK